MVRRHEPISRATYSAELESIVAAVLRWLTTRRNARAVASTRLARDRLGVDVVVEISQIQVWKSASRFGDLRQGQAVNRGLQREYIFVSVDAQGAQCLPYWQPFPRGSSTFPRAVHAHWPPGRTLHVRVQTGAGAMCAQQRARRTRVFDRPEADQVRSAGARSPCSAGTPFAVTSGHLALF